LWEYMRNHTPEQESEFLERVSINPQVVGRLVGIHRDERLKKYLQYLPASYTALYAVTRMTDEEIDAAVQQGVLHPRASSHSILAWSKQVRIETDNKVPPWKFFVTFDRQLSSDELVELRNRIDMITREYDAKVLNEDDLRKCSRSEQPAIQGKIRELSQKMLESLAPYYEMLSEHDRSRRELNCLEDFLVVSLHKFGTMMHIPRRGEDERSTYRSEYVYRIALEFMKTDSRSHRYNYKRRLQQLRESCPDLRDVINEVVESYMK